MTLDDTTVQGFDQHLQVSVIRRAGACLVDWVILFIVLMPTGFLITWLLNYRPQTGLDIWHTLLWNFSLPGWLYFTLSDWSRPGATLGKRLFRLRVVGTSGDRLRLGQALGRTAMKLLPWEISHISVFALSSDLSYFSLWQYIGVGIANGLAVLYIVVAILTHGRRSIHDYVANTEVRLVRKMH